MVGDLQVFTNESWNHGDLVPLKDSKVLALPFSVVASHLPRFLCIHVRRSVREAMARFVQLFAFLALAGWGSAVYHDVSICVSG